MKKSDITALAKEDAFDLIGKQWMLVTAGDKQKFNTMTASWGGIGWLWNKPVAFIFIRPERYTHEFIEAGDQLTLSFYDEQYRKALQICGSKSGRDTDKVTEAQLNPVETENGAMSFAEAKLTLECKKLFKMTMQEGNFIDKELLSRWYGEGKGNLHDVYVVEIENVYV